METPTTHNQPPAEPPKRKVKAKPPPRYTPNVVPLIDVLFMLLLFFLLSTHFRQQEGDIPGSLPATGAGIVAVDKTVMKDIYIRIHATGEDRMNVMYEINGMNVSISSAKELYEILKQRQQALGSTESPVLIEPVSDVRWKFVVEAYNQAVRAHFKNIGFVPSSS